MRTLQSLIDEAVTLCQGQSELGRRLGMPRQNVSQLVAGTRTMSPTTVAQLGDLLRLDGAEVQRLAAEATIEAAPEEKRGVLRRAFFALRATGAGFGADALTLIAGFGITGLAVWTGVIEKSTMHRKSTA